MGEVDYIPEQQLEGEAHGTEACRVAESVRDDSFDKHVKVLHVVNRWGHGGVERYIEGLMLACPDWLDQDVLSICTPVESPVVAKGHGPLVADDSMLSMLLGASRLKAFLSQRAYDVVHIHTNNSSGFLYARAARDAGVKKRVIHSHNSSLGQDAGMMKRFAQSAVRAAFRGAETERVACSHVAGDHLFGQALFTVVPNGIDTRRFAFNPMARNRIRGELRIGDGDKLIGCVGSLIEVKNHKRAIDIFEAFYEHHPASKLIIIGDGGLRGQLEQIVNAKGLDGRVLFLGHVENTHEYYSAMDVLLFPSLYEGLPLTLVEAQCNGLPVVASDAVSEEAKLLDSCVFLSLRESNETWVREVSCAQRSRSDEACGLIAAKGYDVFSVAEQLSQLYERPGDSS